MKTNIPFYVVMVLGALSVSSGAAADTVKAQVNGMVCAFCAQGIEKRLSKMPATQEVFVDLKRKVVAVQAREGQSLDAKAISAEIVEAGYDVVRIESVSQTVSDIKAETRARK
jgi:copper chaperone CopZ